jgi:hypothetical protein
MLTLGLILLILALLLFMGITVKGLITYAVVILIVMLIYGGLHKAHDEPRHRRLGPGGEQQQHNLGPGGEQQPNLGPGGEQHLLGPGGEEHMLGQNETNLQLEATNVSGA